MTTEDRDTIEVDKATGEVIDQPGTDLAPVVIEQPAPPQPPQPPQAPQQAVSLFGADPYDYVTAIERTSTIAALIKDAIVRQKMVVRIKGNEYVKIEGWQWLGSLLGIGAHTISLEPMPALDCSQGHTNEGYEAHVELRHMATSMVVSGAFAECSFHEERWSMATDNAIKSMAQTRATAKAWRQQFGYIMLAAGFEATPAEEMDHIKDEEKDRDQAPRSPSRAPRRENSTHAARRPNPPEQRTEAPRPLWADDLKAKLDAVEGLDLDYVAMVIGVAKATSAEIQKWLDANTDYVNPLDALVAQAVEKMPPEMREKAAAKTATGGEPDALKPADPGPTPEQDALAEELATAPEPTQPEAPAPTDG